MVEESRVTEEQTISAGTFCEFEAVLWGVNSKLLGTIPEKAHVVVSVIACGKSQENLGEIAIPEEPYTKVALKPTRVGDILSVVSGSLWKTEPDDDKDVRVEVKLLVQNLTNKHFPQVSLIAGVRDISGEDMTDASGSDEIRPGDVCVVGGIGYGKDKDMKGAQASLSISAFWPFASGVGQQQGMTITATENSGDNAEEDVPNYPEIRSFTTDETDTDDGREQIAGNITNCAGFWLNAGWEQRTESKAISRWFVA